MQKTIHTLAIAMLAFLAATTVSAKQGRLGVTSPNKRISIDMQTKAGSMPQLVISLDGQDIRVPVAVGLETTQRAWLSTTVTASKAHKVTDNYAMLTGKRSQCKNQASERTYTLLNNKGEALQLQVRAYNDGVAFRYCLPKKASADEQLKSEGTCYTIPNGLNRWMARYDAGYEQFYPQNSNGVSPENPRQTEWGYPSLIELGTNRFLLITEADMRRGHCGSKLVNSEQQREQYQLRLIGENIPLTAETDGSWLSPWRVMMIGSLADVVESTLVTDVSSPCAVKDTSWIKPGVASWIYWAYNHGSQDYKLLIEYVDLAKQMGWPITLVDAEWDEMRNGGKIEDVVRYANDNGIMPLIWYNSSVGWVNGAPGPKYRLNKPEDRKKEYAWCEEIGVKGLKIDFFNSEAVADMDYYIDLLEDAVPNHLLINFHGATIPRGWQRTYPHLMTCEAVYGAEWYNNNGRLTNRAACHNATLPFTRNVIGSMDYTPCTLTDSQNPHITSHAHELALPILFESGVQHMADRPSSYLSLPSDVKDFLSKLPSTWDDTRLLAGYPGKYAVIARQKAGKWYIGGINGTDEPMDIEFDLTPLKLKNLNAFTITDGNGQTEMNHITQTLTKGKQTMHCQPRGGFVVVL